MPKNYPHVLALPGFYKAVVVRNPAVVAAAKDTMKRGQPYLLNDENADSGVITDFRSVHQVGVTAQTTSVSAAAGRGDDDK